MGWFRSGKRYGTFSALAALALQIALSFGHVHPGNFHPGNLHFDGVVRSSHAAVAGSRQAATAQASQQAPAQNPGDDDDYCAICASIFLVSNSFTPAPPQLPVPAGFHRIAHSIIIVSGIVEPRRVPFQSRAPPAA